MVVGEAVVQDAPQLLARLGALGAPPEPLALGLVQRAEQHGHAGGLQALELDGDGVNVADQQRVVGVGGVGQRGRHIEVGRVRVEATPPLMRVRVVQARRGVPVPQNGNDAAAGGVGDGLLDRGADGAALDAGGRVVHQVDRDERGGLAGLLGDPVGPRELLLAREDLLAVDGPEVLVQGLGVGVGVGVDGRGIDLVRGARGRGRDGNGVNEVPTPVADKVDGVGALVEQNLAGGDIDESGAGGEEDLAARAVVEDHGRALVTVDGGHADGEVIQARRGAGDGKGDLVGGLVEAGDVAGA